MSHKISYPDNQTIGTVVASSGNFSKAATPKKRALGTAEQSIAEANDGDASEALQSAFSGPMSPERRPERQPALPKPKKRSRFFDRDEDKQLMD